MGGEEAVVGLAIAERFVRPDDIGGVGKGELQSAITSPSTSVADATCPGRWVLTVRSPSRPSGLTHDETARRCIPHVKPNSLVDRPQVRVVTGPLVHVYGPHE